MFLFFSLLTYIFPTPTTSNLQPAELSYRLFEQPCESQLLLISLTYHHCRCRYAGPSVDPPAAEPAVISKRTCTPQPNMKPALAVLALAAASNGLVIRDEPWYVFRRLRAPSRLTLGSCFHLTAYGGPGGSVGQLGDGQNRIGDDSLQEGQYCIGSNSGLTDSEGRGCILTPPTTQLQCDKGAKPTPGFSVGGNGTISHNDQVG